ncbi:hypothetical protein [Geodermatophilus normandii]|nr:hypothetical protein [Geodermatophilus normandii]
MAVHLHPSLTWRQATDSVVFRVRNAAAHMGLVDCDDLRSAVLVMLRYVDGLLTIRKADPAKFWGDDLASLASELLNEATTERRRIVAAKQVMARARLAALIGRLDESARSVVLASLSGQYASFMTDEQDQPHACPVCAQVGYLSCQIERGHVLRDEAGVGTGILRTAYPVDFHCLVCGLGLERDELQEFEFPTAIELKPDSDPVSVWLAKQIEDLGIRRSGGKAPVMRVSDES